MITKKQLETQDLTHKHGGNQWVVTEDIDKDYCRVSGWSASGISDLAFLAYKPFLTPTRRKIEYGGQEVDIMLPDKIAAKAYEIRSRIASGASKVVSAHIVSV